MFIALYICLGITGNFVGEGSILGGTYVLRAGQSGIEYEFVEKMYGRFAPLVEVLRACRSASGLPLSDEELIEASVVSGPLPTSCAITKH
jgi:hypothetical protein